MMEVGFMAILLIVNDKGQVYILMVIKKFLLENGLIISSKIKV